MEDKEIKLEEIETSYTLLRWIGGRSCPGDVHDTLVERMCMILS